MALKRKLLAFVTLAVAAAAAHADILTFRFTGTVVYSTYLAPLGSQITGTFTYDTSTAPAWELPMGEDGGHSSYAIASPRAITASVNGHTLGADNLIVDVVNNFGGNVEDMADVYSNGMTLDGTWFNTGSFGFRLASGPGKDKVFKDTRLPTSYQVPRFDAMKDGWVQIDGSETGTLLQFTVDRVTVIDAQR